MVPRVVFDTNVLVSALRSRKGASFKVVSLIGKKLFQLSVSVPLVLEYESAAKRISKLVDLNYSDIDDIVDYICKVAEQRDIYYLWRPFLNDPKDDMVLEVAVESESEFIVTHNVRDFTGIEQFGLEAIAPRQLHEKIGELS
jgi:putative PIN family toxin of toxin-antitoxin system